MAPDPATMHDGNAVDANDLLKLAGNAAVRARDVRAAAIGDFMTPDTARLDDRRRAAVRTLLRAIVGTIGADIHDHAARLLAEQGEESAGNALARIDARVVMPGVERRLARDTGIAGELIDRASLDLLADSLPAVPPDAEPVPWAVGHPALSARLTALRAAEGRRRTPPDEPPYATDLPAESQVRFTWWIAASMAECGGGDDDALNRALCDGAVHALSRYDEGDRLESHATRVAIMADLRGDALVPAIEHCLAERRLVLLNALLAHALNIDGDLMRAILIDPDDPRLWLGLRALAVPRGLIARIGYALAEAEQRRDVERFADELDAVMAIDPDAARKALAPLRLPGAFRDALELGR